MPALLHKAGEVQVVDANQEDHVVRVEEVVDLVAAVRQ